MTTAELEEKVTKLDPDELNKFSQWFEEFIASRWDENLEKDAMNGHLDHLADEADGDFISGRCTEL